MNTFLAYICCTHDNQLELEAHRPAPDSSTIVFLNDKKPDCPYLRVQVTLLHKETRYIHQRGESALVQRLRKFRAHIKSAFAFKL